MSDALYPIHQRISTDLSQLKDHDTVDLVVIGSGGAGFSAALNAAIDGARVLLVERMAHVGGTTALSAATTWVPGTKRGLEVNPDDTPERVATFLNLAVGARSAPELRQAFIDHAPQAIADRRAEAKKTLEAGMASAGLFEEKARALAAAETGPNDAAWLAASVFQPALVQGVKPGRKLDASLFNGKVQQVLDAVSTQPGAEMKSRLGTWWGLFNAVTYVVDHKLGKTPERRLEKAWDGLNAGVKDRALAAAMGRIQ